MIQKLHEKRKYSIASACAATGLSRSGYYKWTKRKASKREEENKLIGQILEKIHKESPDKGYRRLNDHLRHDYKIYVNDKRVLRICREKGIQSTIKYKRHKHSYRRNNPQYTAENLLNQEFYAEKPNEKWVADVTEMRWQEGTTEHRLYLSAIMDLFDRRIVAYVIRGRNNNALVFDTFDKAVRDNPDAHPLFHSDRGFQYTNKVFQAKLKKAGMTQSMSRVGNCIDNGVMEGFWGILKRERYYGRKFKSRRKLNQMIKKFIHYYNNERVQRRLGVLTPMEKHMMYMAKTA